MHEQCCDLIVAAYSNQGGLQLGKTILQSRKPGSFTQQLVEQVQMWKMPSHGSAIENRQRPCITTIKFFESVIMDYNVLCVAIVNRCNIFADDPDYSLLSFRKAAVGYVATWLLGESKSKSHTILCSLGSTY